MIAQTIKLLQSARWYGCGDTIEIAKGKNAVPKTWKETMEKVRRNRHMIVAATREENTQKSKRIISWLKSLK